MQTKIKENKSLFKKLIDKIKNNSLYYMITSPDADVISPEEIDSTEKVSRLANSSNISEAEMWNIERAFNESDSALDRIKAEVSEIPSLKKESNNPFSIEEIETESLSLDEELTSSKFVNKDSKNISKKRTTDDRDRSDD